LSTFDPDELMSSGEIAAELGWKNSGTASTLWHRGTFPAPLVDKPRARLWLRSDVEQWVRTAHRRPARRGDLPIES
jgi:predicted DNA-binding transcriptional regulator AlpA